jgi:hypothetical protein
MPITCNCPAKCEIHPKKVEAKAGHVAEPSRPDLVTSTPELDAADQLQLKKLENEFLKAQLRARDAGGQVQAAQQQLQMFAALMFEKSGIKQDEWLLDIDNLKFTARPTPAQKG